MNELSGLEWSNQTQDQKQAIRPGPAYTSAALLPSQPSSGRTTPLNSLPSKLLTKSSTPASDSFSSLVPFGASSANKSLSLQEQQRRLAEEKAKKEAERAQSLAGQDGETVEDFWARMGSGRSTPSLSTATPLNGQRRDVVGSGTVALEDGDEDDLLGGITASVTVPVQRSNPQPSPSSSLMGLHSRPAQEAVRIQKSPGKAVLAVDDDDIFGLSQLKPTHVPEPRILDEEDVLGALGKPVTEPPKKRREHEAETLSTRNVDAHPQDQAVATLVDMGFPAHKAREALETTDSGTDMPAAVAYLLNQAHTESRQKSRSEHDRGRGFNHDSRPGRGRTSLLGDDDVLPPRQRSDVSASSQTDRERVQVAAELGSNIMKAAGTFWKQSTKKVQQAVQEFNSDSDSSQPRWMREVEKPRKADVHTPAREDEAGVARRRRRSSATKPTASATDEAMMLETARPEPRIPTRQKQDNRFDSSADTSRDHSPVVPSRLRESAPPQPAFLRQQQKSPPPLLAQNARTALNRHVIEEQASQAYVSSARRRKPPAAPPVSVSEPDLLDATRPTPVSRPAFITASKSTSPSAPIQIRPSAPVRIIPSVSAIALKSSHSHREAGNAHFKRGDYSSAHQSYTAAISYLPPSHPVTIVLLTNHALTALKIGEPKTAIASADAALQAIGSSKGESETVHLGSNDAAKPMRDYYGKALMRKAEGLEQMERWREAAAVWSEAVEAGHGGATSIQGRSRAEKAANLAPTPMTVKKPTTATKPPVSAAKTFKSAEAVTRLRAANAAADRADDEKFALSESVGARVTAWKGGKADNLRALLSSLETVLWPEAGWKKISLADLVLPTKVKVQYMKGIAKVHPDKIPTTATTEQRMISSAVFSTLNEAWDKFKAENGL